MSKKKNPPSLMRRAWGALCLIGSVAALLTILEFGALKQGRLMQVRAPGEGDDLSVRTGKLKRLRWPGDVETERLNAAIRWQRLVNAEIRRSEMELDYFKLCEKLSDLYVNEKFEPGAPGRFGLLRDESELAEAKRRWLQLRSAPIFYNAKPINAAAARFTILMGKAARTPLEEDELNQLVKRSECRFDKLQPDSVWCYYDWLCWVHEVVQGERWPTIVDPLADEVWPP